MCICVCVRQRRECFPCAFVCLLDNDENVFHVYLCVCLDTDENVFHVYLCVFRQR